jgi:REP element-mobilizing transposase RayT
MPLAKAILTSLLSPETLANMHLRAFTLMPDHLHFLAGVRKSESDLSDLIGKFKSFTTQSYWKRSHEILASEQTSLPSQWVDKSVDRQCPELLSALWNGTATVRPEIVELKNWPCVRPESFLKKHLWQTKFFDHIIRNDKDLQENLDYIAMNPVRAGFVARSWFYPYTGFLD